MIFSTFLCSMTYYLSDMTWRLYKDSGGELGCFTMPGIGYI